MKKTFLLVLILSFSFLLSFNFVFAQETEKSSVKKDKQETVVVKSGEVIDSDFFAKGDLIEISGIVNGDVYLAGGQIIIDGNVTGDVIAAGGTIKISGKVGQNVRMVGGQIIISGDVGKNVTVLGGSIEFTKDAQVLGNIITGGGNISLSSPVGGYVKAGGGNVILDSKVGENVEVATERLKLTSNADIQENLVYFSEDKASIDEFAVIKGKTTHNLPKISKKDIEKTQAVSKEKAKKGIIALFGIFKLIFVISTLIIAWFMMKLFPKCTDKTVEVLTKNTWKSFGIGIIALIISPIVAVIFMITVIAFPIGALLFLFYFLVCYFSIYVIIFWLVYLIKDKLNKKMHNLFALIIAILLFAVVTSIPLISVFIRLLTLVFGFGAIILVKYNTYKELRKKNIV